MPKPCTAFVLQEIDQVSSSLDVSFDTNRVTHMKKGRQEKNMYF